MLNQGDEVGFFRRKWTVVSLKRVQKKRREFEVSRRLAIFAVKLLSLFRSAAQCDVEGDEGAGTVV